MDRIERSALVDGVLRLALLGSVVSVGMMAPNLIQTIDKPLSKALKKLDQKSYDREIQRTLRYMRQQDLLKGDYKHGLQITDKGRTRIKKRTTGVAGIKIPKPDVWDNIWRIFLYDIPEIKMTSRHGLAYKLKNLGFIQLQRSVWVFPYPCRAEVEELTTILEVDKYITYIESQTIDNQVELINKFKKSGIM